jgi:hypothetical protein
MVAAIPSIKLSLYMKPNGATFEAFGDNTGNLIIGSIGLAIGVLWGAGSIWALRQPKGELPVGRWLPIGGLLAAIFAISFSASLLARALTATSGMAAAADGNPRPLTYYVPSKGCTTGLTAMGSVFTTGGGAAAGFGAFCHFTSRTMKTTAENTPSTHHSSSIPEVDVD